MGVDKDKRGPRTQADIKGVDRGKGPQKKTEKRCLRLEKEQEDGVTGI